MIARFLPVILVSLIVSPGMGAQPSLAFKAAGPGLYAFDTGLFRGQLKMDGKFQGLYPLVDAVSGNDLTRPPGIFSPYRVLTTNRRFGNAARDWPTTTRLLPDGGVEVQWAAAESHPLAMTAVYRWDAPDTLDFCLTVKPQQEMPEFELFLSNYYTQGFLAAVYAQAQSGAGPRFVPVDRTPADRGGYVMFPRDDRALALIHDGRWKIPPSPVDWATGRRLAAPLVLRRDATSGITAAMMGLAQDCFAISSPWNPATPDAKGYRSLYLSLFGRTLPAGQAATTRCRLVINRHLGDDQVLRRYEAFVKGTTARIWGVDAPGLPAKPRR